TRARSSAKRSSDSWFFSFSFETNPWTASEDSAWGASLRSSSVRVCSRRASSRNARARSSTTLSGWTFSATLARRQLLDLVVVRDGGFACRHRREHACFFPDLLLDLGRHRRIFLEEFAAVVLALAQAVAVVDVPGARFLDHAVDHAQFQHFAVAR